MIFNSSLKIGLPIFIAAAFGAVSLSGCTEDYRVSDQIVDVEKDNESLTGGYTLRLVEADTSGCKIWIHAHPYDIVANLTWSGNCHEGLATGEGHATIKFAGTNPDKTSYSGNYSKGLMNGYGELEERANSVNGDTYFKSYNGQWIDGHRHGDGEQVYKSIAPNSDTYTQNWTGHFEQNELWGRGSYIIVRKNIDGSMETITKKGDWQNHFLHGQGTELIEKTTESGSYSRKAYTGSWKAGTKTGFVKETTQGIGMFDTEYEGTFRYGRPEGSGAIIHSNGDSFKGEWADGFPKTGHCDFKTVAYSGPCKTYDYRTSQDSGMICLGFKKGEENCFPAFRRY